MATLMNDPGIIKTLPHLAYWLMFAQQKWHEHKQPQHNDQNPYNGGGHYSPFLPYVPSKSIGVAELLERGTPTINC